MWEKVCKKCGERFGTMAQYEKHMEIHKRPPLGVIPKRQAQSRRMMELIGAIERYAEARLEVPAEWFKN
jgi:hypothetical protein